MVSLLRVAAGILISVVLTAVVCVQRLSPTTAPRHERHRPPPTDDDVSLPTVVGPSLSSRVAPLLPQHHRRAIESFLPRGTTPSGSIASEGVAPESPVSWMLGLCNATAATFQNVSGQNTPLLPLGWGATAIHGRLVCIRGRRVFRSYESSDGGALSMWSLKRQQVPLFNLSDLNIAFPSLARNAQVQGGGASSSLASLPPERPDTHRDVVLHTGLIGVIAATYLHGFHVLVNTLIPLVHVLQGSYHHGVEAAMEGPIRYSSHRGTLLPYFDITLLRHPYFGAKFSGGEQLSFEFASTLATTPDASSIIEKGADNVRRDLFPRNITNPRVNADSQRFVLERRRRPPRVLHRADFIEPEDTTHCYCDAVLHDMIDSEFMSSVPQTQKIALGDPLRRRSTRFVKVSLNERYGFLPYGTYPIPPHEYQNYHLWATREGGEGRRGGDVDNNTATAATVTPRLLLLLRNRTRELGDADAVVAMARAAGFHVHVMVPERESIAQQARAARYADLMMGVHGQALTWSIMMDGTAAMHCREVLELTGFGRPLRGMQNVFEVLAADSFLKYSRTQPADVDFVGSTCGQCPALRKILLTAKFPQTRRAFNWQRVWFGASRELPLLLQKSFDSLQKCLLPNIPVPLTASALEQSDRAVPNYPGGKL
jgi:hypothetical protein